MAVLHIEAKASEGVKPPTPILAIDGWVIHLNDGKGEVQLTGSCGDGSWHKLSYDIRGPEGETLAVTVRCGDAEVCAFEVEIYAGYTASAGIVEFTL